VLEALAAGALIEPGPYTLRIRMKVRGIPSPLANPRAVERPPMVTQEWLQSIAFLDEFGKANLARARGEREKVLAALEAGAPVEPGKFRVRIRTRWRRRKIA
jgi:hypothetical protein